MRRIFCAMSFGAELPFGRGKRFMGGAGTLANALVGGWQAQSIINYRSGLPFTPTVCRDVANIGVGGRAMHNGPTSSATANSTIPRSTHGSTRPRSWCLRTSPLAMPAAAFCAATTSGTSIFRSSRRFSMTGSQSFEFRAEVFNLLNSVYFDLPNTAIDTAAGGRVTATSNYRAIASIRPEVPVD